MAFAPASVFAVRSTTEAPIDPLNPPRLDDPNDTRLGVYRFELGYWRAILKNRQTSIQASPPNVR